MTQLALPTAAVVCVPSSNSVETPLASIMVGLCWVSVQRIAAGGWGLVRRCLLCATFVQTVPSLHKQSFLRVRLSRRMRLKHHRCPTRKATNSLLIPRSSSQYPTPPHCEGGVFAAVTCYIVSCEAECPMILLCRVNRCSRNWS